MIPDLMCRNVTSLELVYDDFEMRRVSSVILILLFWLGPLTAAFQGGDESRLPICCRRHGAHHCAMDEQTALSRMLASDRGPSFVAPPHCANFPRSAARITAPVFALAASTRTTLDLLRWDQASGITDAAPLFSALDHHDVRGPPEAVLI